MKRHYTEAFKQKVVDLALGTSKAHAAQRYGCSINSIDNWKKAFKGRVVTPQPLLSDRATHVDTVTIESLKKEIEVLKVFKEAFLRFHT